MKIARSGKELLEICAAEQISLSEYAIRQEMELKNVSREDLFAQMKITLDAKKEGLLFKRAYRGRCLPSSTILQYWKLING